MNLVDCYVKELVGVPYEKYGKWWQVVIYSSWGADDKTELMFPTKEEALAVKPGHKFLG